MNNRTKDSLIQSIKINFPRTIYFFPILGIGITMIIISSPIKLFFLTDNLNLVLTKIIQVIGSIFLIIYVLVFLFEIIVKFIPQFNRVLNFLVQILQYVSNIYISFVKFLIRKAVLSIQEERFNDFSDAYYGFSLEDEFGNDQIWPRIIDFGNIKSLELSIRPVTNGPHWRIGFKFSQDELFPDVRYSKDHPLLHITKDENDQNLKLDYYDENSKHNQKNILKKYDNKTIKIKLYKDTRSQDKITIIIYNDKQNEIFQNSFSLKDHKYTQISAWGDRKPYKFECKEYIINN